MIITIEGKDYTLPASLTAVTLAQRIEFDNAYGKELRDKLKKILDIKNDVLRDMEFTDYHCQLACKSLAFFAGIPLDVVESTAVDDVLTVYHQTMKGYAEDVDFTNKEFQLQHEFHWKDEVWVIAAPELKHDSKMSFGEFITSKQVVQNMSDLGNGAWDSLLPLCCIYFRKKDEPFKEEFINESSERYQLMKSLPLEYAIHVAFFLNVSQTTWLKTFQSFGKVGPVEAALEMLPNTWSSGDGSRS